MRYFQYILFTSFFLIVAFAIIYIITPIPVYPVDLNQVQINSNVSIVEGKKLAVAICKSCHYDEGLDRLSGIQHGNPKKFGKLYSANITKDSLYGIGAWTDEELGYFLRTGVRKDGSYVFDMPKYNQLSDEDLSSLINFLRSDEEWVQAVNSEAGQTQYSFLSKLLLKFYFKPQPYNIRVAAIHHQDSVQWGKYLSTVKYSCATCHSFNAMTYNDEFPEKSWGYFKGGNPHYDELNKKVMTPSLRPVSKYSKEDFISMVQTGFNVDGRMLKRPMIPFNMLYKDEVNAIYLYLMTLDEDGN